MLNRKSDDVDRNKFYEAIFYLIFGLIVVSVGVNFLPEKYYADSNNIQLRASDLTDARVVDESLEDSSFDIVAKLYAVIGLTEKTPLIVLALICAFGAWLFLCWSVGNEGTPKSMAWAFLSLPWLIVYFVYMGQLSKEHFALLAACSVLLASDKVRITYFVPIIAISLYAFAFRRYWFFVLGVWLSILIIRSLRINRYAKTVLFFAVILSTLFGFHYIAGYPISDARITVNLDREGTLDAQTLLSNLFYSSSVFADFGNIVWGFTNLLFPFYVIILFKAQYILMGVFQMIFVVLMLRFWVLLERHSQRYPVKVLLAFYLWIAFIFVQGSFEPDFGSFLKHQAAFVPILILLIGYYLDRSRFGNPQPIRRK